MSETREKVISVRKLWQSEDFEEPDNLGTGTQYIIKINKPYDFKRGLLMMSDGSGYFVPATREGAILANEICVLADDLGPEIDEEETADNAEINEYQTAIAYFDGQLSGSKIILSYETETDNHEELLEELGDKFRAQKLNIL